MVWCENLICQKLVYKHGLHALYIIFPKDVAMLCAEFAFNNVVRYYGQMKIWIQYEPIPVVARRDNDGSWWVTISLATYFCVARNTFYETDMQHVVREMQENVGFSGAHSLEQQLFTDCKFTRWTWFMFRKLRCYFTDCGNRYTLRKIAQKYICARIAQNGVSKDQRRNKWATQVKFHNKCMYNKRFETEHQAALAYNQEVVKYYKDPKLNMFYESSENGAFVPVHQIVSTECIQ